MRQTTDGDLNGVESHCKLEDLLMAANAMNWIRWCFLTCGVFLLFAGCIPMVCARVISNQPIDDNGIQPGDSDIIDAPKYGVSL